MRSKTGIIGSIILLSIIIFGLVMFLVRYLCGGGQSMIRWGRSSNNVIFNQTYTLGTTVFKDHAFTGCSYDDTNRKFNCTTNTYTLGPRTSKVRIISLQEAQALGCTKTISSCPIWMSNYLYQSTKYGGTENRTGGDYGMNYSYWTMTANAATNLAIWQVRYDRTISESYTSSSGYSGRAVVSIKK